MKALNILEITAILASAEALVDGNVYETIEEAVEYTAEAWQVFCEEGGDPTGDEVLEAVLDDLRYLQLEARRENILTPPAMIHHPGHKTQNLQGRWEEGQPLNEGEFVCDVCGGLWVRRDLSGDLSSYLSPWGAELLSEEHVRLSWGLEAKEWKFTSWVRQGPDEFLQEYQELGWYVYRYPCKITGYWKLVASPHPLRVEDERIVLA